MRITGKIWTFAAILAFLAGLMGLLTWKATGPGRMPPNLLFSRYSSGLGLPVDLPGRILLARKGPTTVAELPPPAHGISGRLRLASWAVGGRVQSAPSPENSIRNSAGVMLESLEAYLAPEGATAFPEAWGRCYVKGTCVSLAPRYREGTWMVFLVEDDGSLPYAGQPTWAEFEDPKHVSDFVRRLRAVRDRDPAIAGELLADLEKGGGSLPWTTPRDLLSDLAAVGGPREAQSIRAWADRQKEASPADLAFARQMAERIELSERRIQELRDEFQGIGYSLASDTLDERDRGSRRLRILLRGLSRSELAWFKARKPELMDKLNSRLATGDKMEAFDRIDREIRNNPLLKR